MNWIVNYLIALDWFNCSADELLLTEMIFNGLFNTLDVTQTVALLSCFVCDEKSSEMPKLTEALSGPLKQMQVGVCYVR